NPMTRPVSIRALTYVLVGSSAILSACADNKTDSSFVTTEAAAHGFCGNGRCDHGETCSTCALDCGSCSGTGGAGAGGTSGTGGAGAGGASGSGGAGGAVGVCASNAAPP